MDKTNSLNEQLYIVSLDNGIRREEPVTLNVLNSVGFSVFKSSLPSPILSIVPTIFLTILYKNPLPVK